MWRPEGWESIIVEKCPEMDQYDPDPLIDEKAFEAGADAMLAALRKRGNHRENQPFDAPPNTGTWVFIPDEEGKMAEKNIDAEILKAIKYLDDAPCPDDDRILWDAEKGEFIGDTDGREKHRR